MSGQERVVFRRDSCPACGGRAIGAYKKGTYSDRLTRDEIKITDRRYGKIWDLSRCRDCGHIFADPCPSPEHLFRLYGEVEDPLYEEEAEGRARNFLPILDILTRLVPRGSRLFDVGAATGILLALARDRGFVADGAEPSGWAVRVAAEKYGLRLRRGAFESLAVEPESCAAVTMVDFIEHTPLPYEAVKKAAAILRPGGILALVTPDIHSPWARIAGRHWWHLRPAHLSFFSRRSLEALLRRAGFSIIHERRYAWTFSLHYLLSRKALFSPLLGIRPLASFFRKIPIKLSLGDSFEVYARKDDLA